MAAKMDEQPGVVVTTDTVIVGASAAGLAVGACLRRTDVPFVLLEQAQQVGAAWRRHYERLHLHTSRGLSGLPYWPMPRDYPRYPSRQQVVDYLEQYAAHFQLQPHFEQTVIDVRQGAESWETRTADTCYRSRHLVIATGYTRQPHMPTWPGQEAFAGPVLHSSAYRNGAPFRGGEVLVVGFGNSGGEIAIDLHEHGARPALAVRSAVNVVPRDLLGIPILGWGIALSLFPAPVADFLAAPLLRLSIGDLTRAGLRKLPYGPNTQMREHARIPLLDVGTMRLIRQGQVRLFPGIDHFVPEGVVFTDGRQAHFDAVVLATGYRPALADFLRPAAEVTDAVGVPLVSGSEAALPGLYFCGFYASPTGMLREIGLEARRIAAAIAAT